VSCGVEISRMSRMPASISVRQRVVHHRLVVHRQQLLGKHLRDRVQPRAGATGQYDATPHSDHPGNRSSIRIAMSGKQLGPTAPSRTSTEDRYPSGPGSRKHRDGPMFDIDQPRLDHAKAPVHRDLDVAVPGEARIRHFGPPAAHQQASARAPQYASARGRNSTISGCGSLKGGISIEF